jgi:tetratricopeptide (TPR) repeat protein
MTREKNQVPFSECELWQSQRNFYIGEGIQAWNKKIPFYATSNPFIANTYARLIIRYIQDLLRLNQHELGEPVYIMELGAGSGLFSFYTLRSLLELQQQLGLPALKFKYIMTDFAHANIEFWQNQPNLQPYVQQGYLDFAYYDITQSETIYLQKGKISLTKALLKNHLIVLANYVFDSIKHDFFKTDAHRLQIGLVKHDAKIEQSADNESIDLKELDLNFNFQEVELPYYGNRLLDGVLEFYQHAANDLCFTFPTGPLLCLDYLCQLASNKLLLLVSDKGFIDFSNYQAELVSHGQAFSMTLNFAVLGKYAKLNGGDCYLQQAPKELTTGVLVFGNKLEDLTELRLAASDYLDNFSPGGLLNLLKLLENNGFDCPIYTLIDYLQITRWDISLFTSYLPLIIQKLKVCSNHIRQFMFAQLEQIAANFYYLPGASDVWANLGNLLQEFKQYEKALSYYQQSVRYFGRTDKTLYNMASCHYVLENYAQAEVLFAEVCEINKDNIQAFGWLAEIRARKK